MDNRPWQRHYDYNVPLTIRYPRIPAHYFLNIAAGNFPNKPATNFFGTEITFWDLKQQVLQMANAMTAMGVKKGDRVELPPVYHCLLCRPESGRRGRQPQSHVYG
jgi:long-chain acyl-CoA synthetase